MNLNIETFARGESFIALVVPEGQLLSKGSVGGGSTERQAIQEGINAYFTRKDAEEAASRLPLDGPAAPSPFTSPGVVTSGRALLRKNVVITLPNIERLLEQVIAEQDHGDPPSTCQLTMQYRDAEDNVTTRTIIPSRISKRPRGLGFPEPYLIAIDVAKDEPRTFKLDRIERLERAQVFGPLERHLRNLGYVPPEVQDHQRFSVQEDPDELGYRAIPLPDDIKVPSSLSLCAALLNPHEQGDLVQAALLAHAGDDKAAERCRRFARYDSVALQEDPR